MMRDLLGEADEEAALRDRAVVGKSAAGAVEVVVNCGIFISTRPIPPDRDTIIFNEYY